MRMKKRIVVLIAMMFASMIWPKCIEAYTQSYPYNYEILSDGTVEIIEYVGRYESLTIPSEIDGMQVSAIGDNAFEDSWELKSVEIPSSVVSIGNKAFYSCFLEKVKMSEGVVTIGEDAFCLNRIEEIEIPNSVTTIEAGAFSLNNLQQITLSENIKMLEDNAFSYNCELETIVIPEGVTSIGNHAFSSCNLLENVSIPDTVTYIGEGAFEGDFSLTEVELPNGLTSLNPRVFASCTKLRKIEIPQGVTSVGNKAFVGCSNLVSVKLPDSATIIEESAFASCKSLQRINIPESATTIEKSAFLRCENLACAIIPRSIAAIDSMAFLYCDKLTIYGYANSYAEKYADEQYIPFRYIGTELLNGDITVITPQKGDISTRELFEDYPGYLYESPQEKVIEMILEECEEVNGNRTWAQNVQASYKYMLSGEALDTILKFGTSQLGATSIQDEYLDEATLRLLEGMTQQSNIVDKTIKEVKEDYKWAKDLKSVTKEISSMEMQQLLAKSGHYNEKEIELLMKEIGTNWEDIDKTFKNVGYAIDFNEAALLITTLESIKKSLIEDLLKEVKKAAPGSDVERGLTRALENVSHPYKTVVSKYLQKDCLKVIAKAVEKKGESLVELVVGTGSTGLVFCAESICKIIAYVLPEASADDVINAQNDTNFFRVMNTCVSRKAREFIYNKQNNGNLDIDEEIKNYKLLYHAKLVAAKNASESCEKIAKGYIKNVMGNNGVLLDTFSYKKHIKGCKAKVNAMLNAKYTYKKSDNNLSVSGLVENETSTMSLRSTDTEDELEETDDVIDNSVLVIPSVTEEMPVISVADNAFEGNTEIEYVIVPDGVEEIGASAFKNCTSLKRVILGNSVTRIGEEAFAGCTSLEIVMCPDSLQQIEANSIEGANVTVMGSESSATIEYATANNISYVETEKEVNSISISKMPTKTEYSAGEKLDETGMELSVSYKDGTEATVTEGWYSFVFENANGDVKVHVTYGGVSAVYEISLLSEQGYYEVLCQDENGVNVADPVTYTAVMGDTIQVQAPSVAGYELTSEETTKSILIGEDFTKVIFEYCRSGANNLKNATLSMVTNSFEYTGSEIVPSISITLDGKELVEGTDYAKMVLNNVNVGTAVMIISGLGDYDGIYMKEYEIVSKEVSVPEATPSPVPNQNVTEAPQPPSVTPNATLSVTADKSTALSKVKGLSAVNKKKKQVVLKWKKFSGAKGYQIQYATNKKFKKKKIKYTSKKMYTIKKLKKKKTYYFRVRAYTIDGKKKVYGKWSKVKKIRIKK